MFLKSMHPEALKNFGDKASALVSRIGPQQAPQQERGYQPTERYVTVLPGDQVEINTFRHTDGHGRTIGRYFVVGGKQFGLEGEAYKDVDDLAERISGRAELRDTISKGFVLDTFFQWAAKYHTNQIHLDNFMAALDVAASYAVKPSVIAIPIDHLTIVRSVQIGCVFFRILGRELLDKMVEDLKSGSEDPRHQPPEHALTRLRKKYQGFTVAVVTVTAEPERAVQFAVDAVDDALLPLCFYSPAGVMFDAPCYLGRRGRVLVPSLVYLELSEDLGRIVQIVDGRDEPRDIHVTFDQPYLSIVESAFSTVCAVIAKPREMRTAMEARLLRAIEIFNGGMQALSLENRIVADLASLETLFLRDENEPIQSALSRRVAFLIRKELGDRKAVTETIRRGYSIRSGYLHHGLSIDQKDLLSKVHRIAWEGINPYSRPIPRIRVRTG